MTVINDVKTCSYRGVTFFYKGTSENNGFKTAQHLYPGSDNFVAEQLGKAPRTFSIDAQIEFDNRDRFDNALNTSGSGILNHPMYGSFIVKVLTYSKNDSTDRLGLYDYSIQFIVEQGLILPTIEGISLSAINNLRSKLVTSSGSYIKKSLDSIGLNIN